MQEEIADIIRLRVDPAIPILIQAQDNPPYEEWISFRLTDWKQLGDQWEEYETTNLNSIVYRTESLWKVTLNIITVGVHSDQLALSLSHQFNKTFYLDSFKELGLFYLDKSQIKYTPYRLDSGWESRHQFNVMFNIVTSDTDNIEYVDIIEVTNEIQDPSGDVVLSRTDEIDI